MQLPMNRHPDVAVYNITAFYLGIIKAYGYSIDGLVYNHYLIPSYWAEILNYYKAYYVKKHCFRCKKNRIDAGNSGRSNESGIGSKLLFDAYGK